MEEKILGLLERIESAILEQKESSTDHLGDIKKELNEIKQVTIRNCYDIARLKPIK